MIPLTYKDPVMTLPLVTLPVTPSEPNVPIVVMLGCDAVVRVPLRFTADIVVDDNVPTLSVLVTVRVASVPISVMLGCAELAMVPNNCTPVIDPAVTPPVTVSEPSVPTAVILG